MNMKIFRIGMMIFTTFWILFGAFAVYHHIITEGLILMFVGIGGLIFYSFRLGRFWNIEIQNSREVERK